MAAVIVRIEHPHDSAWVIAPPNPYATINPSDSVSSSEKFKCPCPSACVFRGLFGRLAANPVIDEGGQPIARRHVVHRAVSNVLVALLGARQFHAVGAAHEPP